MKAIKTQIQRIHALLAKKHPAILKSSDLKADFIQGFTEDERTSTKDLTYSEADEVIYFLAKGEVKTYAHYAAFEMTDKQHMKVLSLAKQCGWVVYSEKYGRNLADLDRLGRWIATKSKYKKPLKRLKSGEVSKLIA